MARTRMARLPCMIRTLFSYPYKILPIAQENKYLMIFFLFYHGIVCCVYSLESPHRGDSNKYTQHINHFVENRKDFPKLSLFAF